MSIFTYFKRRALLAQVGAELKAQSHDQDLVKELCYSPRGAHMIAELADVRFRRKHRLRFFMIVTFLLAETMCAIGVPITVKAACFELLNQRRGQIQALIDAGQGDGIINDLDIVELDQISDVGMQLYWSERREHLANSLLSS
ncbi:hypothetical protein AN403_6055 [Pseudomonas fluorescens]|uniref:Uncharacterized protein n=1 Tax=Pseudomonas fluorescens TaxID=294 RepID=A0A0P8Z8U7_PSEFL|nr:hypothetical protein [Pseudomonas fluorescens]KPU61976.1 hypothetical protein AN403_6055 [Pseudomonas fluorescens]